MNKQRKGETRGIEWTDYTFNPIAGCFHGCAWTMPDGTVANCYAEDVAENVATAAYPEGFEHHYWRPASLDEPLHVKKPSKIFVGSMADVFGHWVPAEHIQHVLDVCAEASWHTFQFLTKNPQRLKQFKFPPNCWVGMSSPPDFMWNKPLTREQRHRLLLTSLTALTECDARTLWISVEPLSWDIASECPELCTLDWAVIGAASNGKVYHQPEAAWVSNLLNVFRAGETPVFFKGNLRGNPAAEPWREEYPKSGE